MARLSRIQLMMIPFLRPATSTSCFTVSICCVSIIALALPELFAINYLLRNQLEKSIEEFAFIIKQYMSPLSCWMIGSA
jgi:hypothetical protein